MSTSRWRPARVEVADGHLVYRRTGGTGHPVVLSHGLTDNGLCWSRAALRLGEHFDVIMVDSRGHGGSSRLTDGIEHDPAVDLAQFIEALGLDSPIVMGHSVGARTTARFAAMHPDRVSRVVLEDPPLLPPRDAASKERWRVNFGEQVLGFRSMSLEAIMQMGRERTPGWHPDEFPAWAEAKLQVDTALNLFDPEPWEDYMARIAVPTLVLYGATGFDGIVTDDTADKVRAANSMVVTRSIPGAGHNVRRENFEDYMDAVLGFLSP